MKGGFRLRTWKRRFVPLLCLLLLAGGICLPRPVRADPTDDTRYPGFAGRLSIPDVGIDVALYRSNAQSVVDRRDSAAYFTLPSWPGHEIIADHRTQDFGALHRVTKGMEACIRRRDGSVLRFVCVDAFDGHNTGKYISDESGKIVMHRADLLMYTCRGYWRNVRVVLWKEVDDDAGK